MSAAGILNLDKPAGISSARAVARVKRLLPRGVRVGHAGTLDPFATGVLLILIGAATRNCERLMDQGKTYETTVRFGATTATDDPESPPQPVVVEQIPTPDQIADAVSKFVGTIRQRPPIYSAMKVAGRRAYALARRGIQPKLFERDVRIDAIEILEYAWPNLRLRVDCGRGTYIRALARDLGEALCVGGYLTQLRRTRVGDFRAENAATLEQLTSENLAAHLHPPLPSL